MKKTVLILVSNFAIIFNVYAHVNFGVYTPNFLRAQNGSTSTSPIWANNYFLSIDQQFQLNFWGLIFNPEIGYATHLSTEDETSKSTIFLLFNFESQIGDAFFLRYGAGTFINKIGGDGEEVTLNNGTSTATFYTPNTSESTYTGALNIGVRAIFTQNISGRIDAYLMRPFSSDRRSISTLLSLNYKF